jgi:hypothetical protein
MLCDPLIFRAYWEGEAGEPIAVADIARKSAFFCKRGEALKAPTLAG